MFSTKPPFLSPRHSNDLPVMPPIFLEGMSARVLPLPARVSSLQRFLDSYANIVPPQVGRFRAVSPYVYLMILDYGKLAPTAANLGWFSQREVLFSVPANHYTLCGDRWVFQGVVWFSPFIFVDSDVSMTLGRRVYGWTKLRHVLEPETSAWIRNPGAGMRNAVLSTPVFGQLYSGRRQEHRIFCEVISLPDRSFEYPPRLDGKLMPWTMARNMAEAATIGMRDSQAMFTALGTAPAQPEVFFAEAMSLSNSLNPLNPDIRSQTLNLKQFRDASRPANYCYQALTAANMRIVKLNHFGMLGQTWRGFDSSGGFRVHLHSWPILPIAETLGLYAENSWRTNDIDVVEVKPLNPFWYDVDMLYEAGVNLAERTVDGIWRTPHGCYENPVRRDTRRQARADSRDPAHANDLELTDATFNTTLGVSSLTIPGPYSFLDTTIRVFPLLADARTLSEYLDESLNSPLASEGVRFEPWSAPSSSAPEDGPAPAYVYLVITKWGKVHSGRDDIGDWKGDELCFYIPVRCYRGHDDAGKPILSGVGLVPAVTYASTMTATIVNTELLGWSTKRATFERPGVDWLDDTPTERHQPLLRINTEALPTLGVGQPVEERELLEVIEGLAKELLPRVAREWAPAMRREVESANRANFLDAPDERDFTGQSKVEGPTLARARMLALGVLVKEMPISIYTIKQFRDVEMPERACYQSLTRVRRSIQHLDRLDRLPCGMAIKLFEFQSNPIVALLGLKSTLVEDSQGRHAHMLIPQHPFWARFSCREELPECLYYRVSQRWRPGPDLEHWTRLLSEQTFETVRLDQWTVESADHGDAFDPFKPGDHEVRLVAPTEGIDLLDYLPLRPPTGLGDEAGTVAARRVSRLLENWVFSASSDFQATFDPSKPSIHSYDIDRLEREIWAAFKRAVGDNDDDACCKVLLAHAHRRTRPRSEQPHADVLGPLLSDPFQLTASAWLEQACKAAFIRASKIRLLSTETNWSAIDQYAKCVVKAIKEFHEWTLNEVPKPPRLAPKGAAKRILLHCSHLRAHINDGQEIMDAATAKAVLRAFDLQMIIESILSREWCSGDEQSPRTRARERLVHERNTRQRGLFDPDVDDTLFAAWFDELVDAPEAVFENRIRRTSMKRLLQHVLEFAKVHDDPDRNNAALEAIYSLKRNQDYGRWDTLKSPYSPHGTVLSLVSELFRTLKRLLEDEHDAEACRNLVQDLVVLARATYDAEVDWQIDFLAVCSGDPDFFVDTTMFRDAAKGHFEERYMTADGKYVGAIYCERKKKLRDEMPNWKFHDRRED